MTDQSPTTPSPVPPVQAPRRRLRVSSMPTSPPAVAAVIQARPLQASVQRVATPSLGRSTRPTQIAIDIRHPQSHPINQILSRLDGVTRSGEGWVASCPAHNDLAPSLSVSVSTNSGSVLIHCHANCNTQAVLAAIGLSERDLFVRNNRTRQDSMSSTVSGSIPGPQTESLSFAEFLDRARQEITPERLSELAAVLGVSNESLMALRVGWDHPSQSWLFPEFDSQRRITGLLARRMSGEKRVLAGSQRGLYIPDGFEHAAGPILIVEGASDTAVLHQHGLTVIGRPNANGGVDHLIQLLRGDEREVLVVGEFDAQSDGTWPGRDGAKRVAEKLATQLGRVVQWTLPPDEIKDAREWFNQHASIIEQWPHPGNVFLSEIRLLSHDVNPMAFSHFSPDFISSAQLAHSDVRHEWLIEDVLVKGQPAVIGGPKKTMKTSLIVDLAISLASGPGASFLGAFAVEHDASVLLLSGESGKETLKETAQRICSSKGVDFESLPLDWGFQLPRFTSDSDIDALISEIRRNRYDVVIVDPLYLCLLAGSRDLQASNLFDVGPLLSRFCQACLAAGATPILIHHTIKLRQQHRHAELDDLAFAGIQEYARQWILINRRRDFQPGLGRHELTLNVGSSAGVSSLWSVDVDEGQLRPDFSGRVWNVNVVNARPIAHQPQPRTEGAIEGPQNDGLTDDERRVVNALRHEPLEKTKSQVATAAGMTSPRAEAVLNRLLSRSIVENVQVTRSAGRRGSQTHPGYRLVNSREE